MDNIHVGIKVKQEVNFFVRGLGFYLSTSMSYKYVISLAINYVFSSRIITFPQQQQKTHNMFKSVRHI